MGFGQRLEDIAAHENKAVDTCAAQGGFSVARPTCQIERCAGLFEGAGEFGPIPYVLRVGAADDGNLGAAGLEIRGGSSGIEAAGTRDGFDATGFEEILGEGGAGGEFRERADVGE